MRGRRRRPPFLKPGASRQRRPRRRRRKPRFAAFVVSLQMFVFPILFPRSCEVPASCLTRPSTIGPYGPPLRKTGRTLRGVVMKCRRCKATAVVALPSHNSAFAPRVFWIFSVVRWPRALKPIADDQRGQSVGGPVGRQGFAGADAGAESPGVRRDGPAHRSGHSRLVPGRSGRGGALLRRARLSAHRAGHGGRRHAPSPRSRKRSSAPSARPAAKSNATSSTGPRANKGSPCWPRATTWTTKWPG